MNIYGRPMFQGGSIRMAPSIKPLPRYQNGGIVKHHALQLEKYQGVNDRGVLDIYLETGEFVNPKAAYALLQKMAASGMDIRDFLPQDSSSQYRSRRDEQFKEVSPVKEHYKELGFPTKGASAMLSDALRPVGEKISQEWHSRLGKTPTYEFSEETIVEPAPDYSPNISADIYEDQTPPRDTRGFPVPREKPMPPDIRDFIDKSEAVSAARGGPIRRQAGGGIEAVMPADLGALVEPPPMPMPAPPPPGIDEALPQVEQAAQNVGEQEGAQYAMEVMSGLNAAEESGDPEQAINALRGNEMPISGRYEELATYVGDDDAERTPESVLLMVQPTIMLTEQGAMDSGIGSLMENVVGDIDMETAQGAPTAMGEGVGSLMMAQADTGVGQEPPVNFNYGGPVQRFSGKFGSEVRKAAKERAALLSEMIGLDTQAALDQEALDSLRNTTKAQTFFDIAQAGLNLAAGDPSKSFAENFAMAAAPVAANLSARGGAFAKEERDLDKLRRAQKQKISLSAAESAIKEINERKAAEAARETIPLGQLYEISDRKGNVIGIRSLNEGQFTALTAKGHTVKKVDDDKSFWGTGQKGRVSEIVSDADKMMAYVNNELSDEQKSRIDEAIAIRTSRTSVWDNEKNRYVMLPAAPLTPLLERVVNSEAYKSRFLNLKSTDTGTTDTGTTVVPSTDKDKDKALDSTSRLKRIRSILAKSGAPVAGPLSFFKKITDVLAITATGESLFGADRELRSWANNIKTTFAADLLAALPGKEAEPFRVSILELVPEPGKFYTTQEDFRERSAALVSYLDSAINTLDKQLNAGAREKPTEKAKLIGAKANLKAYQDVFKLFSEYDPEKKQIDLSDPKYYTNNKDKDE